MSLPFPPAVGRPCVAFVVEGRPIGKGRPRSSIRYRDLRKLGPKLLAATQRGGTPLATIVRQHLFIHVHTDDQTEAFERRVAAAAYAAAFGQEKPRPPFKVTVTVVHERPKRLDRHPDQGRLLVDKAVRPDLVNVVAAVWDGLQRGPTGDPGQGLVRDDARIVQGVSSKLYAAVGEGPRVEVVLEGAGAGL